MLFACGVTSNGKAPRNKSGGPWYSFWHCEASVAENIYLDFATDKIQNSSIWKKNFDIVVVNRLRYWGNS